MSKKATKKVAAKTAKKPDAVRLKHNVVSCFHRSLEAQAALTLRYNRSRDRAVNPQICFPRRRKRGPRAPLAEIDGNRINKAPYFDETDTATGTAVVGSGGVLSRRKCNDDAAGAVLRLPEPARCR